LAAPNHFKTEVRHAILRLERTRRVVLFSLDAPLAVVEARIRFEDDDTLYPADICFKFARLHQIGMYDAIYVVLALRTGAALASRDGAMLAAAERAGIGVIDLR
jgi:predicted nucleic acid-binding protein